MNNIIVKQGQSLLDIAVVHSGDASAAFDIALSNNLSITAKLIPGQILMIPKVVKKNIVALFNDKNQPATDYTADVEVPAQPEGIGYWIINQNFKVS